MKLPPAIERNLSRITMTAALSGALLYVLGLADGTSHLTRLGALIFAVAATVEIVETGGTARPRGTAMVAMAAFMLVMEGAASMLTQGLDGASYIEIAIGLYLLATLWQMVRAPRIRGEAVDPYAVKQVIVIRRDLKMRQGKAVSQGSHASGEFMREQLVAAIDGRAIDLSAEEIAWMRGGMAKITARTDSQEQFDEIRRQAEERGLKVRVITDSGRTEFHNVPTITALAIGPALESEIDKVTGKLTLL